MQQDMIPDLAGHSTDHDPCKRIAEHIPGKVILTYISRGDCLRDDQIATLFADPIDGLSAVEDELFEAFNDQHWHYTDEVIREACEDEGIDPEALDVECWDSLREVVWERDDSDPFGDLLRETGDRCFRYSLGVEISDYTRDDATENEDREAIAGALDGAVDDARISELLGNASYGGTLCLSWYGDVEDALRIAEGPQVGKGATLTMTGGAVLVYDGWNGSGHDVTTGDPITVPWDGNRLRLDAGRTSWSEGIAGVHKPAYAATIAATEV